MKITIAKSEKEFDCIAAWRIIGEILNKPESVIGLSTGRTTGNLHRLVGEIYSRYPFDVPISVPPCMKPRTSRKPRPRCRK